MSNPKDSPGTAGSVIGNLAEATPVDVPLAPLVGPEGGSGEDYKGDEQDRLRRGAATIAQAVNAAIDAGVREVKLVHAPAPETAEQARIRARLAELLAAEQKLWARGGPGVPVDAVAISAICEERLTLKAEWEAELRRIAEGGAGG